MVPAPTERLRDGRDIAAVLRGRRKSATQLLVVHQRTRDDEGPARLAVVASRRVGGAVERNRAKRLLREAARRLDWSPGIDVVLVARAACADSGLAAVTEGLAGAADSVGAVLRTRIVEVADVEAGTPS